MKRLRGSTTWWHSGKASLRWGFLLITIAWILFASTTNLRPPKVTRATPIAAVARPTTSTRHTESIKPTKPSKPSKQKKPIKPAKPIKPTKTTKHTTPITSPQTSATKTYVASTSPTLSSTSAETTKSSTSKDEDDKDEEDDPYDEPEEPSLEDDEDLVWSEDYLMDDETVHHIENLPFVKPLEVVEDEDEYEASGDDEDNLPDPSATSNPTLSPTSTPSDPPGAEIAGQPTGPFVFSAEQKLEIPSCSHISAETLVELQETKSVSVFTYLDGRLVTKNKPIPAPASICIIVAVPQSTPAANLFPESPVEGKWPDTIHLYVGSPYVRFSIPPLRALPSQQNAHRLFSKKALLYHAELNLSEKGVYHVAAENESPNWFWAMHGWKEASRTILQTYQDVLNRQRKISNLAKFTAAGTRSRRIRNPVAVLDKNKFPADIEVSESAQDTKLEPCYNAEAIDLNQGSWFRQEHYPNLRKETADEHGFSFDLDHCHLDYFNDRDTIDCLANKNIHVFGDSNVRRLSRAILSGGRWCHNISDKCQGEDNGTPVHKLVLSKSGSIVSKVEPRTHKGQFSVGGNEPFAFGDNSKLWFSFFTSMAYDPRHWLARFYDKTNWEIPPKPKGSKKGPRPFDPSYIKPEAQARAPRSAEHADLVIVGMSSWDDAFDLAYGAYEKALTAYRDTLEEAYPDADTKLVLRTNQGYCCRKNFIPANMRRFTGGRLQHFSDIAKRVFQVKGGTGLGGRMSVIDASALTGRPEVIRTYTKGQLSNNHQAAAHVRTEGQVLLNMVCKRDAQGKAVWKGSA